MIKDLASADTKLHDYGPESAPCWRFSAYSPWHWSQHRTGNRRLAGAIGLRENNLAALRRWAGGLRQGSKTGGEEVSSPAKVRPPEERGWAWSFRILLYFPIKMSR